MAERYTVKHENNYGVFANTFETLDEALYEFLGCHADNEKVQITAEVPQEENDEWDF